MMIGAAIFLAGIIWHWGSKLGMGSLPGDLTFKKGSLTVYVPLATSLVISVLLSLLLWLFRR